MPGYGVVGPEEGSGLLSWDWATERLTRAHDYWLATVWPDGRPHVTPVWAVWRDGALWFSCSRRSRKARNLTSNPAVAATTDDAESPVVVEGRASLVADRATVAAFAEWADTKYETSYGVDFYGDPANACIRIDVVAAFALSGDDFTGSPTRWSFTD
jgi:PPOX class probable F420-dependent enzyme